MADSVIDLPQVDSPYIHVSGAYQINKEVKSFYMTFFKPLEIYELKLMDKVITEESSLKVELKAPSGTRVLVSLMDQRLDGFSAIGDVERRKNSSGSSRPCVRVHYWPLRKRVLI